MLTGTLEKLNLARRQKRPVVLVTFLNDDAQGIYFGDGTGEGPELTSGRKALAVKALETNQCQLSEDENIFFQPFNPPLRLIIIGAVHITQPLSAMAMICGFQVTVIDPRQAFASSTRFPDIELVNEWPDTALESLQPDTRTAIVTLTHDPKLDDPALRTALKSEAFYIGALGSRKTQQARHERLTENGCSEELQARIHGPVGLDIGARSPAEIAVSILAQITQSLHSR